MVFLNIDVCYHGFWIFFHFGLWSGQRSIEYVVVHHDRGYILGLVYDYMLLSQDPRNSDRSRIDWSVFRFNFSNANQKYIDTRQFGGIRRSY